MSRAWLLEAIIDVGLMHSLLPFYLLMHQMRLRHDLSCIR